MSQKATLNILEDLKASKEELAREAKALELALQTKSAFTSAVSHELRTPLAAIKEGIAIVLDGTSGTLHEHQKEFLELAKRNVDRLNRLINDILDFQKLESGRMVFKIEPNDINSLIREVALTMEPLLRQKGLDFSLNLLADLPKIRFDHDRIFQVMANLMSNSLKMTEKGSITVSTAAAGNTVRVSVKDTGCGIREDDIPRLFRQFEQLEGGSERRTGGTGLGLAISKQIVEAHKGKIWAESKYGEWTTFSFILPITERRR
jgi:signal transduction histidine kinase